MALLYLSLKVAIGTSRRVCRGGVLHPWLKDRPLAPALTGAHEEPGSNQDMYQG